MTLIAFLLGINVGGNHKVQMADLRNKMVKHNTFSHENSLSPTRERVGLRGEFLQNNWNTINKVLQ